MKNVIHRRNDCRACGSLDIELVFSLKPTPVGEEFVTSERLNVPQPSYPIDLFICRQCGLAQLTDVVDPDVLYGEYLFVTGSTLGMLEHFDEYAANVIKVCKVREGSFVVDIGSNEGVLLKSFKKGGMKVLGVEPAVHIADKATAEGVETIGKFFHPELARQILKTHGSAKIVTSNNVFANIDDLTSFVNGVNELLASDGVFVFESHYLVDLVQNMVFDYIYHEHLSEFSVRPIKALFKRVGLDLVMVRRLATRGGSIRYFVQRPGGPLESDGSVDALLALEEQMGLYKKETYIAYSDKINLLKEKTRSFLAKAKGEGKSVAGYGASVTCTTLMYHFEIGGYIDYLVDDNGAKQGRFSPGLHLPVYPTSVLHERKPDYIVVLAWRYAEPIMKKNHAYGNNGGRFLVPVPEFKVV